MEKGNKSNAATLRQKAEELLKKNLSKTSSELSEVDTLKLIHELQVHQIELELQNEELILAKEQAEVSTQKYAELYYFAPSGYFTLSEEGKIIELNLRGANMLGKASSLLLNSKFGFFVSDETKPTFNLFLRKVFKSNAKESCEVVLSTKDNSPMYVHLTGIVTENGEQCLISATDISQRKQAEEERLESSEERFRLLYENAKIGLYRTTPDGTIVLANKALVAMLGYQSFDELAKRNVEQDGFETPHQRKAFLEKIEQTGEVENFETTWIRQDRTSVFVRESARAIRDSHGKTIYYDGTAEDITEHKYAEEARLISQKRLREFNVLQGLLLPPNHIEQKLKLITDAVVRIMDADFARIWMIKPGDRCEAACIHAQVTEGPHVCRFRDRCLHLMASSGSYTHTNGQVHARVPFGCYKIGKVAAGEEPKFLTNNVTTDPSVHDNAWAKELGLVSFAGYRLVDTNGTPLGVLALFSKQAISEEDDSFLEGIAHSTSRVLHSAWAEAALRDSEERYRLLFEKSADGILIVDVDTKTFKYANPALCRMLGYTEEELTTLGLGDIHPKQDLQRVINEFESLTRGDKTLAPDIPCLKKDGSIVYADINSTNITIEGKACNVGLFRDITERKQAEETLKKSEIQLQVIIESTADGILAIDGDGKVIKTNNRFAELWKIPPVVLNSGDDATLLNFVLEQLVNPKQFLDKVQQLYNTTDEDTDTLFFKDGRIFERYSAPLLSDEKIIGRVWSFRDITGTKRAEDALRESRNIIQNIIDNSPSLIYILDLDGKFILANRKLAEVLNFPAEKLLGNTRQLFMSTEFADQHRNNDIQIITTKQAAISEEEIIEADGRHIYLTQKFPLFDSKGKIYAVGGISTDITGRKRAEQALIDSENRAHALIDAIPDLIFRLNKQGVYLDFKATKEDLAFQAESIIGKKNRDITPPEFADLVDEKIRLTLQTGQMQVFEYQLPLPNKGICEFEARMVPSSPDEVIVIVRDVTERKKSEEKINMLALAVESSADCIFITNKNHEFIFVNDSFCKVYGFEKEEIVGQPIAIVISKNNLPEIDNDLFSTINKKKIWSGEGINKRKNGDDFPIQLSLAPLLDDKGELIAITGVARDITERKLAEEALRDSEQRYRLLIETANEGILVAQNGFLKFVNPMMQEITGFTHKELLTLPFINHVHPEDRELITNNHIKRLKGDLDVPRYHYRFVKNDGSIRWIEMNGIMIEWEGQPATLNMLTDITERKQTEKALRDSEQRYRLLIETVNEGILVAQNGFLKFVNPMMQVITGFTQEELLTLPFINYVHPEDREILISNQLKRLKGEQFVPRYQFRIMKKDGSIRRIEMNGIIIEWEGQPATLNMLTDITERTQAEEALQRERTLLRLLIDNVPDLMYTKDTACRKTLVNIADVQNMGVKSESEVLGKDDFAFFPKEMAEKFYADDLSVIQNGQPLINKEEYTLNEAGQEKWVLTSKFPLRDQSGQIIGLAGIGRDITERKKAEEELRESEERFRHLFELSPEAIMLIDPSDANVDWPIVDCNETACKMNGYTREELIGKSIDIVNITAGTPEERAVYLEKLKQAPLVHLETFHRHRDGHIFPTEVSTSLVTFLGREMVLGIDRDITERKLAEEEIQLKNQQLLKLNTEKDKFFSIISHDLRGPFSGFLGLTELMAEDLPSLTMNEIQVFSVKMRNSAANLYRLLENLLQWSRMQQGSIPFDPEVIQLRSIIDECIAMVMESAKNKGIDLTSDIPENLKVFADNNMLQTVVRNLLSNAVKFTPKGGKISILATASEDKSVEISVKDSGIGMKAEMIGNLFRLDVKTNRKGTEGEPSSGLGLLLCKEFVEKQGGKIWVESEVENLSAGKAGGSIFHFTLQMST